MSHTKRSPEFHERLAHLQSAILHTRLAGSQLSNKDYTDLLDMLANYTTDSGCVVKAADDEPIFVLRAHDVTSDKLVDEWCELQIEHKLTGHSIPETVDPNGKIADARECAREMRAYPNRKFPD